MNQETHSRNTVYLNRHLGERIVTLLQNPSVTEIMMNPDGTLWVDQHGKGQHQVASGYTPAQREASIAAVAGLLDGVATKNDPIVEGELPFYKHRFAGVLPPVSEAPLFSIRTHHMQHLTIADYVRDGVMTAQQTEMIYACLDREDNIIISGGTRTGKSTLVNALLLHVARCDGVRILVVEDTRELQCPAKNCLALRTHEGIPYRKLVRTALRLRPDRIVVGEVRGAESLDLLDAWNTGHKGGLATLHANAVAGVFLRLQRLVAQAGEGILTPDAFAESVNVIIHLAFDGQTRRVTEMVRVVPAGQSFHLVSLL